MRPPRSALAALAVAGLSLGVAALEAAETEEACLADGGSGKEDCALSLRQLRVRSMAGAVAPTAAAAAAADGAAAPPAPVPAAAAPPVPTPASAPTPALVLAVAPPAPTQATAPPPALVSSPARAPTRALPVDPAQGVPGGWGEPASFADEVRKEAEQNLTLRKKLSQWEGLSKGSCAAYGCVGYYKPWLRCQCNLGCYMWGNCCSDYTSHCWSPAPTPSGCRRRRYCGSQPPAPSPSHVQKVMTLYHQTDQAAANLIIANGFKPGRTGWCGGAIYFATSKNATYTKATGPDSHKGAMLQCQVDVGRVLHLNKRCYTGINRMNQERLTKKGYDSVVFNPGDGDEHVIWDKSKVLSIKQVPLH